MSKYINLFPITNTALILLPGNGGTGLPFSPGMMNIPEAVFWLKDYLGIKHELDYHVINLLGPVVSIIVYIDEYISIKNLIDGFVCVQRTALQNYNFHLHEQDFPDNMKEIDFGTIKVPSEYFSILKKISKIWN